MNPSDLKYALIEHVLEQNGSAPPASDSLRNTVWSALHRAGWLPAADTRAPRRWSAASNEQLLAAFLAGDADAFDSLYDRLSGQLTGYARRSLTAALVDDVVQESFLVLYRKAESVLGWDTPNVRGFLFAVLRNHIGRALARAYRDEPSSDDVADQADDSESALDRLARERNIKRLAHAIADTCNLLEQEVVQMTLAGCSGPDIARELGLTANHVRVIKHRALGKLRTALQEDDT